MAFFQPTTSPIWIVNASMTSEPASERYQKLRGTTERPARSLAIHCTRKRAPKIALPIRPTASQRSALSGRSIARRE